MSASEIPSDMMSSGVAAEERDMPRKVVNMPETVPSNPISGAALIAAFDQLPRLVPLLGQRAAVIAGDGRHHQMFAVGITQQLAVADQIPAVLVIGADIDVLPAAVQHRRGPEQLPARAVVVMQLSPALAVEAEGILSHPLSAGHIHLVALGQVQNRALADAALERETIHDQIVAQHPIHDQPRLARDGG